MLTRTFRPWYATAALLLILLAAACNDNSTSPGSAAAFARVEPVLSANNCRSCHNSVNLLFHGNFNLGGTRATDSAAVEAFLDFETPELSTMLLRLTRGSVLPHSLKLWDSATDAGAADLVAYARELGAAGHSHELVAQKVVAVPAVDGVADATWAGAPELLVPVDGGFAGATTVSMRAMYVPGQRVYFLLQWNDPTESVEREPWLRTISGWLLQAVAPSNYNNSLVAAWRSPPTPYRYEDKFAIIWNTEGASAVSGFNEGGCAVLCHTATTNPRPLKYTNGIGTTADMWHWKLVRTNAVHRLDDQYVWWNRDLAVNANGGRSGDAGGGEYTSNPLVTLPGGVSVPQFTSGNQPAGRFYMVNAATAAAWAATNPGWTIDPNDIATTATADNFAVGDRVAHAITTLKPNVDRSDVEAYGVWAGGKWTLEISRALVTSSTGATPVGALGPVPVDVQFDPTHTYHFGVAVFDNAQIEHSMSPGAYRMRFQP